MFLYDTAKMTDVSAVGGKAFGLARLAMSGCCVPDFFVITADTNFDDERFSSDLNRFAKKLNCELFSVRSSGVNEDAREKSYAGQFLTRLNVKQSDLLQAVRCVKDSFSRADAYAGKAPSSAVDKIAVIVQKQITGARSGVLFTESWSSRKEVVIESVEGAGESLVGGNVTPTISRFNKDAVPEVEGVEGQLLREALRLEKEWGIPLDIEWTISDKLYLLQARPLTALGDRLPDLPQRHWNFYVSRDFCILCHSVQRRAAMRDVQEAIFGFSIPIMEGLLINGREYYSDESMTAEREIWEKLDDGDFFERFIREIEESVRRTRRVTATIKRMKSASLGRAELFHAYRSAMRAYIESYVPLMMRPDDYLLEKAERLDAIRVEDVGTLVPTWEHTEYSDERADFLRAVATDKPNAYLEKYEWINNPLNRECYPMTLQMFEARARQLSADQAKKELIGLIARKRRDHARFKKYIASLPNEETRHCAQQISRFIYLRTHTAGNSDRLFYYIRKKLLTEIKEREHVDEIFDMRVDEIADLEKGVRISQTEWRKRRGGELIVFFNGESTSYYGNAVYGLQRDLYGYEREGDLTGNIACPGETRGTVKVLHSFDDVEKVERGDIVVVSMTTPDVIAAIECAAGIVTDEGGITCHAAIIAREYSIPCLVGTEYATQILKDGMHIFLDCISGRVVIEE